MVSQESHAQDESFSEQVSAVGVFSMLQSISFEFLWAVEVLSALSCAWCVGHHNQAHVD